MGITLYITVSRLSSIKIPWEGQGWARYTLYKRINMLRIKEIGEINLNKMKGNVNVNKKIEFWHDNSWNDS